MVRRSILALAIFLAAHLPVWADGPQTGTIDGRVLDTQGRPLEGATVTLVGKRSTRTTKSGADGGYRFGLLIAGVFTVTAELEGLGRADLVAPLNPGQRRGLTLILEEGLAEEINVTSEAPMVSRYDTASTSAIEAAVAENVAYLGRNHSQTLRQLPGVVQSGNSDDTPTVNGGLVSELQVSIEGVDTSNTRQGGRVRVVLPTTALAETRIEGAGFGAEYGRNASGVLNTTLKTGSNEYHGDFLYIGQNQKWRAQNQLMLERPDEAIHSLEAGLGGFLVRDKAWFFSSYSELSDNQLNELPDGSLLDSSKVTDAYLLKLNSQPSARHQIAVTGIESLSDRFQTAANIGDRFAIAIRPQDTRILTGTWSAALSDRIFVEAKAGGHEEFVRRDPAFPKDPSTLCLECSDNPANNGFRYRDLDDNLRYNGLASGAGSGFNYFERKTASATATLFQANHELKFGLDFHDTEFEIFSLIGVEYFGRGYDSSLPGGFRRPQRKRIFESSEPSLNTGSESAAFVQDRVDVGDHWSFDFGLRVDYQTVDNDVGTEVDNSAEVAPRVSAVYDPRGDGGALVRATAGRYYQNLNLDFPFSEFSEQPTGQNIFDEYDWSRATQRYDSFRRHQNSFVAGRAVQEVEHRYKDEVTAGVDWQLARNWVFKSRLAWHEIDNLYWGNEQFSADGLGIERLIQNWSEGFREYRALSLELNRRFAGGWSLQSNLTVGELEGNTEVTATDETLLEGLGGIDAATGAADVTSANRDGRLFTDVDRLNVIATKRFTFGSQSVTFGGFFFYATGAYVGQRANTNVVHPQTGVAIPTVTFLEPRDARQLEDVMTLSGAVTWHFPVRDQVRGQLGFEIANITDEQEVVFVSPLDLRPSGGVAAYQLPREFRLEAGIRF